MRFEYDEEKAVDFENLTKKEFLKCYSYITEKEYELEVEE